MPQAVFMRPARLFWSVGRMNTGCACLLVVLVSVLYVPQRLVQVFAQLVCRLCAMVWL